MNVVFNQDSFFIYEIDSCEMLEVPGSKECLEKGDIVSVPIFV